MASNKFIMEVLPDGRIKVVNEGGFDAAVHADADKLLEYLKSLTGGDVEVKSKPQSLNPQHQHKTQHHHRH